MELAAWSMPFGRLVLRDMVWGDVIEKLTRVILLVTAQDTVKEGSS